MTNYDRCTAVTNRGARCKRLGKWEVTRNGVTGLVCVSHGCEYVDSPLRNWDEQERASEPTPDK